MSHILQLFLPDHLWLVLIILLNSNTPGQIRMLDEQPWKGQASFRAESFSDWHYQRGNLVSSANNVDKSRGGTFKGNNRLSIYTVDEAGHIAPFDQPEAVGAVVRRWLQI